MTATAAADQPSSKSLRALTGEELIAGAIMVAVGHMLSSKNRSVLTIDEGMILVTGRGMTIEGIMVGTVSSRSLPVLTGVEEAQTGVKKALIEDVTEAETDADSSRNFVK